MIRWTAEERALREAARKLERTKRDQAVIREKVTTGSKLQHVEAPVLGKRRVLTDAEKAEVHAAHEGRCYVCGREVPAAGDGVEWDHVLDRQFFGSEDLSNFGPICPDPCHKAKTKAGAKGRGKADRRRRFHNGEQKEPARKLQGAPFSGDYQPMPRGRGFGR